MKTSGPVFDEITLHVSDLKASRTFYVDRLGFAAQYEGEDFLVLKTEATKILLHATPDATEHAHVILQVHVPDVDSLYDRLAKQGVRFARGPVDVKHEGDPWSPRREARLDDPDGYDIALFTPKRRT